MSEQKTLNVAGTKVTLNPTMTPSEKLIQAGNREVTVTDTLERVIVLKKPDPLSGLDFLKAAGAGADGINMLYLSEVAHLKYVASIDGDVVVTPGTDGELRALYKRLGEEGNLASAKAVAEHFIGQQAAEESLTEIKKS